MNRLCKTLASLPVYACRIRSTVVSIVRTRAASSGLMLLALEQATATSPIRPRTVQQASGCARLTIHAIMPALYTHPTCPILDKPALIAYAHPAFTEACRIPYLLLRTGLSNLQEA